MGAALEIGVALALLALAFTYKSETKPTPPLPASIGQRLAGVRAVDDAPRAIGCWHNPRTYEAPYIATGEAWVRLSGGDCR